MQTEATRTRRGKRTSPSLPAGDRLGRFSVLSELGAGGMGRIYEAYDPSLDRRIALKLVHDAGDEEHRQRLVREAQALARLDHPNVVTVHEVGVHDESLFVAMELLRGGTLKQWIAENPVGSRARLDEVLLLAKACFEASLGTDHPNVPVVLSNLGTAYKAQGRLDLAISTLEDAVERRRKTDGDRHPGVARTLFNLGSAQYEAQRYDDAIDSLREGRSILEDAASTSDVRVARYDLLVGTAQVNLGRFDEAAATLEPLLDVFPVERGDAGRFARRTRLYLAIATLATDLERARTLVQLAGDTTSSDDGEHALFEHLDWLVSSVEYVANG